MKTIHEAADLPDPAIRPLVHPLDLPQARKPFATAWWLSVLTTPTVFFGMAAVLWAISNNYVTPIVVPIIVVVAAVFARKYYLSEAWAYIPRKRQDHSRRMPTSWSVLKSALSALIFLFGLIALIQWFVNQSLPSAVSAYSVGMGAGLVLIMVINLVWTLVTPSRLNASLGGWLPQLVSLLVVTAALAYGYQALTATGAPDAWATLDLLIGAAIIVGVQVALWFGKLWAARQSAREETSTEPA